MDIFLQQLVNGIVLGAIYALVALGYTMVYGILGLINFAHGEVVMIGALVALAVIQLLVGSGVPLPGPLIAAVGLAAAIPVCMALGYAIERIAYRPLRQAPRLAALITAIGVSIVLQNVAMIVWGRQYHSFPALLPDTPHHFAGATVSDLQLFIVALAALIMAGLMGVNVNTVISLTFVIGSALAAVAGIMVAAYYGVAHYFMGFMLGLKAFTAAVLGGIGNIAGAMLGGLLLGMIESFGAGYIGPLTGGFLGSHYQDVFAFLVLILVLVFRPSGLLGERVADRT